MEYATIDTSGMTNEGLTMSIGKKGEAKAPKEGPKGSPPPASPPPRPQPTGPPPVGYVPAHGHPTGHPGYPAVPVVREIPPIPVYMDDDEEFVDYRKPGFWSYTPSVFMFFFGLILLILFTAGGGIVGFIIGIVIFGAMLYIARNRLWARTGYWFTNHKIVYHDGSKIRLVPYDEIALSTLAFEGENCMFSTIYHQEIILKGIIDMEQVVAYISKRVKEERKKANGGGPR